MGDVVQQARELIAGITPGPWRWSGGEGDDPNLVFIDAAPQLVARLADLVEELRKRDDVATGVIAGLRSYKSLPPGMVWQDYYSPDDVIKRIEDERAEWVKARTIETVEQLDALPPESIVKTEGGSVACRFYDRVHGVTFGDERPFVWTVLATELPAVVLWHPEADR
jgi:hypothetical protein